MGDILVYFTNLNASTEGVFAIEDSEDPNLDHLPAAVRVLARQHKSQTQEVREEQKRALERKYPGAVRWLALFSHRGSGSFEETIGKAEELWAQARTEASTAVLDCAAAWITLEGLQQLEADERGMMESAIQGLAEGIQDSLRKSEDARGMLAILEGELKGISTGGATG